MAQPDPTFVSQFGGPRGGFLCTAASAAMALDAFTGGAVRTTAQRIDQLQDDHKGGIGLDDAATAWARGWGLTFSHGRRSWATITRRLAAGEGAVLQGSYNAVPAAYRAQKPWSATSPHAVYVSRSLGGGMVRVYDPIRQAPTVWPQSVVRTFYLSGLALAGWGEGSNVPTRNDGGGDRPPGVGPGGAGGTGRTISLAAYAGIPGDRRDNLWDVVRELTILNGAPGRPAYGGKFARERIALGISGDALVSDANIFLRYSTAKGHLDAQVAGLPSAPGTASGPSAAEILYPVDAAGHLDIAGMQTAAAAFDPFGAGAIADAIGQGIAGLGTIAQNAVLLIAILALLGVGLYVLVRS